MRPNITTPHSLEILEARIAPAGVGMLPTIRDAEIAYDADPIGSNKFVSTKTETPLLLKAGQVLTTGVGARSGTYLLFVEQGEALIFTSDLNNNKLVDYNEITGIAAGAGLRLISFVDINGDIVTNLDADRTLSDSNNTTVGDATSPPDDPFLKGDGRLLNNSTIEKIELRSLSAADLTDQNTDGAVDELDVALRLALSSYSIHGNILVGKSFGVTGDTNSGLIIDDAGRVIQQVFFTGLGTNFFVDFKPTIGAIKAGTAASGEYFSFAITAANDIQGTLLPFTPLVGQVGGDISTVRAAATTTTFNIHGLYAGNGGSGARGGNIENIQLNEDNAGGYDILAGNGGSGRVGGAGGSIINFSDAGSVTSKVVIQSGDGGVGTANIGGDGGVIVLNEALTVPLNLNGGVSIILGDGGKGFTAGGAGASLAKGVVTTPEGTAEYGRNLIGSTRDGNHDTQTAKLTEHGGIGRTLAVDFNGDGFGDIVFTTSEAEQLVVQMGDGTGRFPLDPLTRLPRSYDPSNINPLTNRPYPGRLYLDAPIGAEALTVGDFNGDGHQDIATASSAPGSFGGLFVYLSHYEDANLNGLSKEEDVNGNKVDDFLGYYTARQTPLPTLNVADPDGGTALNNSFRFYHSAHAINDLETGDFDGDGYTDIAVLATYVTKAQTLAQVLIFMRPDVEDKRPDGTGGRPTGEYYANFGTKAIAQPPTGANPLRPFAVIGGSGDGMIEATALSTAATHDVILGTTLVSNANVGGIGGSSQRNFLDLWDNSAPSVLGPTLVNLIVFGVVDTDRRLGFTAFSGAFIRDFTILDFDNDGRADYAEVTETPAGFLVAARGDGAGDAVVVTENFTTADNSGFFFGGGGLGLRTAQYGIRATDADGDGDFDEVAVLDYDPNIAAQFRVDELRIVPPPRNAVIGNPGATVFSFIISNFAGGKDNNIVAWDIFYPSVFAGSGQYAVAHPTVARQVIESVQVLIPLPGFFVPQAQHYLTFHAGDGGTALIGRGGNGGFLGGGLGTGGADLFGALNVTLPQNTVFRGQVNFDGGQGGQGFTTGGNGGNISGVVVRYVPTTTGFHSLVNLHGGNGGIGVAAAGGSGGNIESISVETGSQIVGGNGGPGLIGGKGGSILGHGLDGFFDNRDIRETLNAGSGGNGITLGGDGGSILNFKAALDFGFLGNSSGIFSFVAGNGGSASSGPGGNGGSVLNDSPLRTVENRLGGDILLQAGNGGNGDSGGLGGSVVDFINNPTASDNPSVLSVIAGNGGNGVAAVGGIGGEVTNIKTPTRGIPNRLATAIPATVYEYNRILAGNGGSSSGSLGGNGGSVTNIESKNDDNPFVVVAGTGGSGLGLGGDGGSIVTTQITVGGSSLAKVIFIAGAGGSAAAFVPNSLDLVPNQGEKAFGGKDGKPGQGGHGGDILNTTQLGGIASRADFIAGNGGDTVNYGTIADQTTGQYVGKGGSIKSILADGTIGNILPGIAILSYNDLRNGETLTDFVTINLRDPLSPGTVDDSVGNVGIVVGAAGRLKQGFTGYTTSHTPIYESNPAFGGKSGSLSNVTAREIMSAVAGSVERIAAIQAVADISILAGAHVGLTKTVGDPVNYRDRNGNAVTEPVIDGLLLDGALVSSTQPTSGGNSFNYPGNVFVLN